MKMRKNVAALTIVLLLCSQLVPAQGNVTSQGILSIAKMAGACGILDSMIQLQKTTKLSGGDEFVSRFWSLEAARLGMTVEELSQTCDESVAAYNTLWEAAEG